MKLLLDTHVFIEISRGSLSSIRPSFSPAISDASVLKFVSVATFWEIAIKFRLGKLQIGVSLDELGDFCRRLGFFVLAIEEAHILAELQTLPETLDPFDRLLLAQAQVEGMRLITTDRALAQHPLAFTP